MNKSAIQAYTEWAKVELTNAVKQKAFEYGITETSISEADDVANGRVLNRIEQKQRSQLVSEIKEKGYKNVVEEVTYTWFNRFIALRFMEVNGYLPSHTRVFSDDENKFNPQILKEALTVEIDGLDREIIVDYLDKNNSEGLFKYLIISQCNALNKIIPVLFEKISNYTELLFPNNLLKKDSILDKLVNDIPEEDWKDQVQILGWIYQFYIADKKDAAFKSKETIAKDTLAAVTQLFTPDWIVRYMVENSLGRLWLESYPNSSLKNEMKYFVEDAPQSEEVKNKIEEIRYRDVNPENIHIIEPCCGSGHILVYVFDLLVKIYEEKGYKKSDIPTLILRNNLVGLDIDKRASQLAYFSLMMKARSVDNRLFTREEITHPMIFEIVDSETIFEDDYEDIMNQHNFSRESINTAKYLAETFKHGKVIGSLLIVNRKDYKSFISELKEKKNGENWNIFETHFKTSSINLFIRLAKLAIVMSNRYDVMITNPPYIGISSMEDPVKNYALKYYKDSKADMYAMFMESNFVKKSGFMSIVNMQSWMFLSSFKDFRKKLFSSKTLITMAHLGAHAFDMISGEVVQTTTFVLRNGLLGYKGVFFDLTNSNNKEKDYSTVEKHYAQSINFLKLPEYICSYYVTENFIKNFEKGQFIDNISSCVFTGSQNITGDNERFLRYFWEVEYTKLNKKWIGYSKGGEFRKYYGNIQLVVDWSKPARDFYKNNKTSNLLNESLWFKEGITYSAITSNGTGFRYLPEGCVFDKGGPSIIVEDHDLLIKLIGLLNSKVASYYFNTFNPTVNLQVQNVKDLPILEANNLDIKDAVISNIELCKKDWNSRETSIEFERNPIIKFGLLEQNINEYIENVKKSHMKLKENEEFINNFYISLYGLEDTLEATLEEKFNSISIEQPYSLIVNLFSYFVGCLFGRFSLDKNGIICGDKHLDLSNYETYIPDIDNIVPICDDEYFEDDILGKFIVFMRNGFGKQNLEENLKYISKIIGGNATPRENIRQFFVNNFYKEHLRMYRKRPIYWLFDSGKKNGFKALIYMHRYSSDLLAKMRTDYVHEQQERYRTQIANLESEILHLNGTEKSKTNKRLAKLKDQLIEINEYEEKIHHLADQMIEIDLDDGVKVNYAKFQDVLAPIK